MAHEVFERTAGGTPPVAPGTRRARKRPDVVAVLAGVVVAAAVAVRLAFLHNQSYWGDEIFSVTQASGNLGHVLEVGRTEIHTPLYAVLLWAWERLGGSATLWTHSLSALFGLGAIVVSWTGLRAAGLSDRARLLAVALTAANGFGIVYSQESRPYALVLLGATGVTAATVRLLATFAGAADAPHPKRDLAGWGAWALLTSAAHLLGAALVGALALVVVVLALRRRRTLEGLVVLGLGALALVPQLTWILTGIGRPGFASGTSWIIAPVARDVGVLLTTVFAVTGLRPLSDGFAWTSWAGVAFVVLLLLVAGALRLRGRVGAGEPAQDARGDEAGEPAQDARGDEAGAGSAAPVSDLWLGLVLVGVAAGTAIGVFVVSQVVHIWTLRNMIVVLPALTWGTVWVATALPRRERERQVLAVVVLVAMLVSLGTVASDLRHPYKTDWRGVIRYLAQERAKHPSTTFSFFGSDPVGLGVAADRGSVPDAYLRRINSRVDKHPRTVEAIEGLRRVRGRQVVLFYDSVGRPEADDIYRAIRARLADPSCRRVPIYGLVVVSCP